MPLPRALGRGWRGSKGRERKGRKRLPLRTSYQPTLTRVGVGIDGLSPPLTDFSILGRALSEEAAGLRVVVHPWGSPAASACASLLPAPQGSRTLTASSLRRLLLVWGFPRPVRRQAAGPGPLPGRTCQAQPGWAQCLPWRKASSSRSGNRSGHSGGFRRHGPRRTAVGQGDSLTQKASCFWGLYICSPGHDLLQNSGCPGQPSLNLN